MIATGLLFIHARCKGYLSFNTSLSHSLSCSLSPPSLSQVAFTSLFMNILSTSDLFNPVALPSTAHGSAHTHTHRATDTGTTQYTYQCRETSPAVLFVHTVYLMDTHAVHSQGTDQHTHTHTHALRLIVCICQWRQGLLSSFICKGCMIP